MEISPNGKCYDIIVCRYHDMFLGPCPLDHDVIIVILPLSKNREIFERFLENKIELIPMFPLI